ncbi:MAG: DNA/RNA nuclease SfsA [Planctomycetota bacterium]
MTGDVLIPFEHEWIPARWVRRYKRFLIDVELETGEIITAHCPDPGRMTTAGGPGCRVWLTYHDDPRRKLAHTLQLVEVEGTLVLVNNAWANRLVLEALRRDLIPELTGYTSIRPEMRLEEGTRLDFLLEKDQGRCWLEVKSVTLVQDGIAAFPDAVTKRGVRHLEALAERVQAGERGVLLFLLQREDAQSFRPADEVDPAYGEALRAAMKAGVEVLIYQARIGLEGLGWGRPLPWTQE